MKRDVVVFDCDLCNKPLLNEQDGRCVADEIVDDDNELSIRFSFNLLYLDDDDDLKPDNNAHICSSCLHDAAVKYIAQLKVAAKRNTKKTRVKKDEKTPADD